MSEIPKELETWQDFFNFEAKRVAELTEEELKERIKKYSRVLSAVKAYQHASVIRLQQISKDQRDQTLLQDLKYEPKAEYKSPRVAKQERLSKAEAAIRTLMKTFKITREEAFAMLNKKTGGRIHEEYSAEPATPDVEVPDDNSK